MGRKKGVISEEVKLERAKRFNTIVRELKEKGITQKTIAEKMCLSQQSISKIVKGKNLLTEENARKFIEEFPGYCNLEWLLGNTPEELRTNYDMFAYSLRTTWHKQSEITRSIKALATANNYILAGNPESTGSENGYLLKDGNNGKEIYLSATDVADLISDICDFVGFRISRLMKKNNKAETVRSHTDEELIEYSLAEEESSKSFLAEEIEMKQFYQKWADFVNKMVGADS